MRPHQARFVTVCQQLLALGVVLAVLTPAAAVVSLDVIGLPGSAPAPGAPATATAPTQQRDRHGAEQADRAVAAGQGEPTAPAEERATVPAGAVEATVTEVPLTEASAEEPTEEPIEEQAEEQVEEQVEEPTEDRSTPRRLTGQQPSRAAEEPLTMVVSEPQPVEGYGAVGVTWSHAEQVEESDILLEVRTRQDGAWSGWTELEYHDDHAPAPDSAEGQQARPGTEPLFVGEVDLVQLRAVAEEGLPADMSLAVVEPGTAEERAVEAPELTGEEPAATSDEDEDAIELQAASTAERPTIFSRAQWGADERLRDGSPSYGDISGGFVHHTVNGNDYSRDQVPGIIRGIYAYHTQSRGWSDIGYNFLVDKFGRIWEGRYGGVARPVIGAHTLGYNHDSFAMSAIGNFDVTQPTDAMLRAYGALFAWKLGLHGVDPADTSVQIAGDRFKAINGHRDAGSTACPGQNLYAKLGTIREYASEGSQAVELEQLDSDLAGTPHPDLVVRRASDGRGMILPTGGLTRFARPSVVGESGWAGRELLATPDVTGDGLVDLLTFDSTGALEVRPGRSGGEFGTPTRRVRSLRRHKVVAAAGDIDSDGRNDLVARRHRRLVTFLGTRRGGFRKVERETSLRGYQQLLGAGDVTGDGHADLWGRNRKGRLFLHRGTGRGTFSDRARVPGEWVGYDRFVAGVDYTEDDVPDLVARRTDGRLMLFPGRGDGTLARPVGPIRNVSRLAMVSGAGQLVGSDAPDLVASRDDGTLVVVANRGGFELGKPVDTGQSFRRGNLLLHAGDFDRDGDGDVILRRPRGPLVIFAGNGTGRLADPVRIGGRKFRRMTGLRAVADITGDGRPDLVGRNQEGALKVWPGNGLEPLGAGDEVEAPQDAREAFDRSSYDWAIPVSDLRRKGRPDLVVRESGTGLLYRVNGKKSGLTNPRYLGEAVAFDLGG